MLIHYHHGGTPSILPGTNGAPYSCANNPESLKLMKAMANKLLTENIIKSATIIELVDVSRDVDNLFTDDFDKPYQL